MRTLQRISVVYIVIVAAISHCVLTASHVEQRSNSMDEPLDGPSNMCENTQNSLMINGVRVNSDWKNALQKAVEEGNEAATESLTECCGLQEISVLNLLHIAAKKGHKAVMEILIEKGVDVNSKNSNEETPLLIAAEHGKDNVVEFLLANHAEVRNKNKDGLTALHYVSLNGNKKLAKILLEHGADVNAKTNLGYTPLHHASALGKDVAKILIQNGANVNSKANDGMTPLHRAAWQNRLAVGQILLDNGADVTSRDHKNRTSEQVARQYGNLDFVAMLDRYEA